MFVMTAIATLALASADPRLEVQPPRASASAVPSRYRRQRAGGIVLAVLGSVAYVGGTGAILTVGLVPDRGEHGFLSMGLAFAWLGSSAIAVGSAVGAGKLLGKGDAGAHLVRGRRRDRRRLGKAGIAMTVLGAATGFSTLMIIAMERPPFLALAIGQSTAIGMLASGLGMMGYARHYTRSDLRMQPIVTRDFTGLSAMGRF